MKKQRITYVIDPFLVQCQKDQDPDLWSPCLCCEVRAFEQAEYHAWREHYGNEAFYRDEELEREQTWFSHFQKTRGMTFEEFYNQELHSDEEQAA